MTAYASDALTIVALTLFLASIFMLCAVLVDLSLAFFECLNFTLGFRLNAVKDFAP